MSYLTVLRILVYVAGFSILAWGTIAGLIVAVQARAVRNRQAGSPCPVGALQNVNPVGLNDEASAIVPLKRDARPLKIRVSAVSTDSLPRRVESRAAASR
jgi:hypothetical protein